MNLIVVEHRFAGIIQRRRNGPDRQAIDAFDVADMVTCDCADVGSTGGTALPAIVVLRLNVKYPNLVLIRTGCGVVHIPQLCGDRADDERHWDGSVSVTLPE